VGGGDAPRGRHLTEAAQPQAWLTWGAPPPPGGSLRLPQGKYGADCVKSPGDRVYYNARRKRAWNS
jgi:hypothetical protein